MSPHHLPIHHVVVGGDHRRIEAGKHVRGQAHRMPAGECRVFAGRRDHGDQRVKIGDIGAAAASVSGRPTYPMPMMPIRASRLTNRSFKLAGSGNAVRPRL